jgi:hypothetical protein
VGRDRCGAGALTQAKFEKGELIMMLDNGEKAIRVKRAELLEALRKNRDTHKDTFEQATVGYRKRAIEELDSSLADAKAGKKIRRSIGLVEPMNQTKDYDRVIRMLEMTVDDVVTIGATEFQQYVMDDWSWKEQFTASNSAYLG